MYSDDKKVFLDLVSKHLVFLAQDFYADFIFLLQEEKILVSRKKNILS